MEHRLGAAAALVALSIGTPVAAAGERSRGMTLLSIVSPEDHAALAEEPVSWPVPISDELRGLLLRSRGVPTLVIEMVSPADRPAGLRAFLNLPSASLRTSTETPRYLGAVAVVPKSLRPAAADRETRATLDMSQALATLLGEAPELTLTLVPDRQAGPDTPPVPVSIRRVELQMRPER